MYLMQVQQLPPPMVACMAQAALRRRYLVQHQTSPAMVPPLLRSLSVFLRPHLLASVQTQQPDLWQ
jgi:hypothetical protein